MIRCSAVQAKKKTLMKYKYKCSDEEVMRWSPGFDTKLEIQIHIQIQIQRNYTKFAWQGYVTRRSPGFGRKTEMIVSILVKTWNIDTNTNILYQICKYKYKYKETISDLQIQIQRNYIKFAWQGYVTRRSPGSGTKTEIIVFQSGEKL